MRANWSIRNYNAFLREARAAHGIDYFQARVMYREMRSRLGYSLRGVDVALHKVVARVVARSSVAAVPGRPSFRSYAEFEAAMDSYSNSYDLVRHDVEGSADYP